MKFKHKVLIYNFLAFAVLYVLFRFILYVTLSVNSLYLSAIAAIASSVLAPKFAVANIEGAEKIVMKWVFRKGFKVL
tara:strand:- start:13212 stop:13442 length:231 start_codon:yes stop_codon:yes gene_type:complete